MKLWIRSQDKERLIKVSNVQYTYRKGDLYSDVRGKHYIGTYYDNLEILGEYATKERAIEVLDEIQNFMRGYAYVKKTNRLGEEIDLIPKPILIYNMPKE